MPVLVLAADGEGHRTGGKIKQISVECGVIIVKFNFACILQVHINLRSGCRGVLSASVQERIKRRGGICVQQRLPEAGLACFTLGNILALVSRVAKTCLPVPSLEVVGDPSQFTAHANIEEIIIVCELLMARTCVTNAAVLNAGGNGETRSIGEKVWNRRVCYGERIKRVYDGHTDALRSEPYTRAWDLEWIRRKRHRCQ